MMLVARHAWKHSGPALDFFLVVQAVLQVNGVGRITVISTWPELQPLISVKELAISIMTGKVVASDMGFQPTILVFAGKEMFTFRQGAIVFTSEQMMEDVYGLIVIKSLMNGGTRVLRTTHMSLI